MLKQYFPLFIKKNGRDLFNSLAIVFILSMLLNFAPVPDVGKGLSFFLGALILYQMRPRVQLYSASWEYFLSLPLKLRERLLMGMSDFFMASISLFIYLILNFKTINYILDLKLGMDSLSYVKAFYLYIIIAPLFGRKMILFPPNQDMRTKDEGLLKVFYNFSFFVLIFLMIDLIIPLGAGLISLSKAMGVDLIKSIELIFDHILVVFALIITAMDIYLLFFFEYEKGVDEHRKLKKKMMTKPEYIKYFSRFGLALLILNLFSFGVSLPFSKNEKYGLQTFHDLHFKFYFSRMTLKVWKDVFFPDRSNAFYMIKVGDIDGLEQMSEEEIRKYDHILDDLRLPLEYALYKGQYDIALMLIEKGWNIETSQGITPDSFRPHNDISSSAYRALAQYGEVRHFEALAKKGIDLRVKKYSEEKTSDLVNAAASCNTPVVEWLGQNGSMINRVAKNGQTPIYWALTSFQNSKDLRGDCIMTIDYLFRKGADLNYKGTKGESSLALIEQMKDKKKYAMAYLVKRN